MELNELLVMVTGGAGFIGSHLADKLLAMKNRVIIYDNFDEYYSGKERNIQHHHESSNLKVINADILDYDTLGKCMKKVDVVFHLAAQPGVRYSFENAQKTNTVNTTGTLNVLKAAKERHIKKFIFASSSSVYGAPEYLPIDEKHPTTPISVYGVTKLAAERYCQIYNSSLDLPTVILRYHTVYGPRQRPDMAIYKWTERLFENKPPIIYGDGQQTRDFTYVDDITDGTLKAAETDGVEGETFNLGGGERTSVNRTVRMLLNFTVKEDIEPIYDSFKLGDVFHTYADISKGKKLLGYDPKINLEKGIRKFIEWFELTRVGQKIDS